jgi:sugar lactone lactonase YvrE
MRTSARVYASVALLAALPTTALATVLVQATVPASVAAGSTVLISCYAEGRNASGMFGPETMQYVDVSVVTVPAGGATGTLAQTQIPGPATNATGTACKANASVPTGCNFIQGSVSWTVPPDVATFTATCTVTYKGGFSGNTILTASGSTTFTTTAAAELPPTVSPVNGPTHVLIGAVASFDVTASDPNAAQQPLAYEWRASGGAIAPDPANPASAIWTAPATPGSYSVTVKVSRGALFTESTKAVSAVLAEYQAGLPVSLRTPGRIAGGDRGALYVVDPGSGANGQIALLTPRGETLGLASMPEPPLAATYGAGFLWVTTSAGNVLKVNAASGKVAGKVPLEGGRFSSPIGISYEPTRMQLWVADAAESRVRVIGLDGRTVRVVAAAAGAPLRRPIDVAFDSASGRAWVLSGDAKKTIALDPGEPVAVTRFLHAYDLDGNYVASYGSRDAEITRAGGIAVGADGRVYVSDAFQGEVVVFGPTGTRIASVGEFGAGAGQLKNPMGLGFMVNGDLAITSTTLGRVDRFGNGASLPTCAGDADCDGLPDQWERDHGLNPNWAGDALLDLDGDGLSNLEEYALGTDPRNRDTDGDGYGDGDEVLAGFDPRNPNDHRPTLAAYAPASAPPGLVKLSAVASGVGTCAVSWRQAGGPAVSLRSAESANASFIARTAAAYEFDASAVCGTLASLPARVRVEVTNVPPIADAGRIVVTWPGGPIKVGASFSSDANADRLTFAWDQSLGPATSFLASGSWLSAHPRGPGYYAYQLTATDPRGASGVAEVPVLVLAGPVATAVATSYPADPAAGTLVFLDATASVLEGGAATFAWSQVGGPAASLAGADQPVASFQPAAAGRYVFEVSIETDGVRSPPARAEVFVAGPGGLPSVTASASASVVAVNTPVSLEATGSRGGLGYRWAQVSGPAAGLTDSTSAAATAVPFAPGFYVFEATAGDGAAVSRPARVAFEARVGGKAIPVARAAVPGLEPVVGQLVFLDGRGSAGAVNYRWTQVEGPWVVLSNHAAVSTFRAHVAGRYVFELEVDDGAIRSAPARVEVNVSEQGVQ